MTPEEITIESLNIAHIQLWVTSIAIFLGPLAGVVFTFWFQSRKEKSLEKHRLFLTLMAERKALVISRQVAQALNIIDVVFSDNRKVKVLWHEYYALLHQQASEQRFHKWLELLAAMADDLKYSRLPQVDIDKFYIPQGHADELEFQQELQKEWLRILKNTESFLVVPKNTP